MKNMAGLPFHFAVKIRIFPSNHQKNIIRTNSDANRFIYNELVARNRELYQLKQIRIPIALVLKQISSIEQILESPVREISNLHGWLNNEKIDSDMKAHAVRNYRMAWLQYKQDSRAQMPSFHKRQEAQRYQTSNHYKARMGEPSMWNGSIRILDRKFLHVNKLGRIRFRGWPTKLWKLTHPIRIGTATISADATGRYYMALQLAAEYPFVSETQEVTKAIGIDLNTKNFLTDSDGNVVINPRFNRVMSPRLANAQRRVAHLRFCAQTEGRPLQKAANYQRQRLVVAKLNRRIKNQRRNFLHSLSTIMTKNHSLIVAENLQIDPMQRNRRITASVKDVGWRMFIKMLAYKAKLYGAQFVLVDPRNTTQTCSACGYLLLGDERLTLRDRVWRCPRCNTRHDRDHNAAKNILERGVFQLQ